MAGTPVEVKFAGTTVEVDSEVVGKITTFNRSVTIAEADVTGAEDLIDGADVVHDVFVATRVGETATVEGIALSADDGQSALREAAETGGTVALKHKPPVGPVTTLNGFFTAYSENGGLSAGIYTWSGTFRINSKTTAEA